MWLPRYMTRPLFRLLVALGLALSVGSGWADQLTGRVVGIADGDTLTVLTPDYRKERVRGVRDSTVCPSGRGLGSW